MINYVDCDITTIETGIIGHVVNCRGLMGSGVAWAIRKKWPIVFQQYSKLPTGQEMLGVCDVVIINQQLCVANLYGQLNCGNDGQRYGDLEAIEQSLRQLCEVAIRLDEVNIYLPKIASKRAGLDWETEVCPLIQLVNKSYPLLDFTICIYEEA